MAEQKQKRSKRPEIQYYKPRGQSQQTTSHSEAGIPNLSAPIPPKSGGQHSRRRRGGSRSNGTDRGAAANDPEDDSTVGTISFPSAESDHASIADPEIATHSYQQHDSRVSTQAAESNVNSEPVYNLSSKSFEPKPINKLERPTITSELESSRFKQKQPIPLRPVLSKPQSMPSQDARCTLSKKLENESQRSSEMGSHPGGFIQVPPELVASINQSMQPEPSSSTPEYFTGGRSPRGTMRPKSSDKPTLVVRPTLSSRENPVPSGSSQLCDYWSAASNSESQPGPSVARNLYPNRGDDPVIAYTSGPSDELVDPLVAMNISNWADLLDESEAPNSSSAGAPFAPVSSQNVPLPAAAPSSPLPANISSPQPNLMPMPMPMPMPPSPSYQSSTQSPISVPNTPSYAAAARLTSPPQPSSGRSPPSRSTASSMVPIGHLRHPDAATARSPRPDEHDAVSRPGSSSSGTAYSSPPAPAPQVPSAELRTRAALEPAPASAGPSGRRSDPMAADPHSFPTTSQSPSVNVCREVATKLLSESICALCSADSLIDGHLLLVE